MALRFRTAYAVPPGGCYEYASGGETVQSRSRAGIERLVRDLRVRQGLPVKGDPFTYVMEYMCPRLPDGFCSEPSGVRRVRAERVKEVTAALFGMACVPADEAVRRMGVCISCPEHETRGFCTGCTGLMSWIYRGFGGRRGKLPPDEATGVCRISEELVAASATVDRPAEAGYPEGCWRRAREVTDGQS